MVSASTGMIDVLGLIPTIRIIFRFYLVPDLQAGVHKESRGLIGSTTWIPRLSKKKKKEVLSISFQESL